MEAEPEVLALPSAPGALAPGLVQSTRGLVASWIEPAAGGHRVRVATLSAEGWSTPTSVVQDRPLFVNWADVPAVGEGGDGALLAWWPEPVADAPYAYAVQLARSVDGGATWVPLGTVHDDGTATEHGFASMAAVADGVRVSWLDGRATTDGGAMSLRTAVVGAEIGPTTILDERVCDCCGTDAVALPDERTLVVARDRSESEVRDVIAVKVPASGPPTTSTVSADGWEIAGCPVNGPQVVSVGQRIAVAWFTEADGPEVRLAWSEDGGTTFGAVTRIARPSAGRTPLGRVGLTATDPGTVVVSWLEAVGEVGLVRVRSATPSGLVGNAIDVGETTADRASGFPVLGRLGDSLVVVWTVPEIGLQGQRLPIAAIPPATRQPDRSAPHPSAGLTRRLPTAYRPQGLEGGVVDFSEYDGRPVLVNLWATWCAPCLIELPDLVAVHENWGPRGLQMVSVAVDDQPARARAVAVKRGMAWRQARDGGAGASRVFGTGQLPTTLLYGPDGRLLWSKQGPIAADDPALEAALAGALGLSP